jgi:hypothetical protein
MRGGVGFTLRGCVGFSMRRGMSLCMFLCIGGEYNSGEEKEGRLPYAEKQEQGSFNH